MDLLLQKHQNLKKKRKKEKKKGIFVNKYFICGGGPEGLGKSLIFFKQRVCLLKNLIRMGLNMLKLEAVMSVPQRPRHYSPQLELFSIKPLYHMTCKHEEILGQELLFCSLPRTKAQMLLANGHSCCFILLAAKGALRIDLHIPPGKVGFWILQVEHCSKLST